MPRTCDMLFYEADRWISMPFCSDPADHAFQEDCAVVDESIRRSNAPSAACTILPNRAASMMIKLPAARGQFPAPAGLLLLGSFDVSSAHQIFLPIVGGDK